VRIKTFDTGRRKAGGIFIPLYSGEKDRGMVEIRGREPRKQQELAFPGPTSEHGYGGWTCSSIPTHPDERGEKTAMAAIKKEEEAMREEGDPS